MYYNYIWLFFFSRCTCLFIYQQLHLDDTLERSFCKFNEVFFKRKEKLLGNWVKAIKFTAYIYIYVLNRIDISY